MAEKEIPSSYSPRGIKKNQKKSRNYQAGNIVGQYRLGT
jgi:hypothetical protein